MAIEITLDWDQYIYDKIANNALLVSYKPESNLVEFLFKDDGSRSYLTAEDYTTRYKWLIDECVRQKTEEDKKRERNEISPETEVGERSEGVC